MEHHGEPSIVLACDTSTRIGSVALLEYGNVTAEVVFFGTGRDFHSERLLEEIARIFERRGLAPKAVSLFVASLGPGSFTGVRTTLATMKGLAYATGRPLVGVPSLYALAWPLLHRGQPVLAALDARKGELYAALYDAEGGAILEPMAISAKPLNDLLRSQGFTQVLGVGEGVLAYREELDCVHAAASPFHVIRASVLAFLGMREKPIPVDQAEPLYVRRPEAEIRLG